MKTKEHLRHLWLAATLGIALQGYAQADILGHNGGTGYFLGWNNNALQPLQIRHDGSWPIEFWTSLSYRGQINPTTSYVIGTAPLAPRNGFMLLSGRSSFMQNAKGPFSRLHLV